MGAYNKQHKLSRSLQAEAGAAMIEAAIVLVPCLAALGTFFASGMMAAFLAEATTVVIADVEFIKATSTALTDPYGKYAPNLKALAKGHPNKTMADEAIVDLEGNIDKDSDEERAFVNFFAGRTYGTRNIPIGFSSSNDYIQASVGIAPLDATRRIIYSEYKIPNLLRGFPGFDDVFILRAGGIRRSSTDLSIGEAAGVVPAQELFEAADVDALAGEDFESMMAIPCDVIEDADVAEDGTVVEGECAAQDADADADAGG
ncbi:hypothetical protein OAO01_06785 [Oligoflexia bacterium]|nr:hypothetical protein [Oligoflexia bacterium]